MNDAEPAVPFSVHGGAGGQQAVTEDLEHAAVALADAATAVDSAGGHLRSALAYLASAESAAARTVLPAVWHAEELLEDAADGPRGCRWAATEVDDAALRLRTVAATFLAAEHAAQHRISTWTMTADAARDFVGLRVWAWRSAASVAWKLQPWRAVAAGVSADFQDPVGELLAPDAPPPTTGLLNGTLLEPTLDLYDTGVGSVSPYAGLLGQLIAATAVLEALFGEPHYVGALPTLGSARAVDPPQSLTDLIDRLTVLDRTSPREVSIERLVSATGEERFIVFIPGTADMTLWNAETSDYPSNFQGVAGLEADSIRFVIDAMRSEGIPRDAEVMLVGHSQGGIAAASIAASSTLAAEFTVSQVVTFGSPVGRFAHPERTEYLHVAHHSDITHAMDARANPAAPHVTTVIADPRRAVDAELSERARTIVGAHEVSAMAATAAVIDASGRASLVGWKKSVGGFLTANSATQRTYTQAFVEAPLTKTGAGGPAGSTAPQSRLTSATAQGTATGPFANPLPWGVSLGGPPPARP